MKFYLYFLMALLPSLGGAQNFNYLSTYNTEGVPDDLVNTPISQRILDNIAASLPEGYPVPEYNPHYIADSVETNFNITALADVWVSFAGEGAGYRNVLGFYTYDLNNPPTSAPEDEDITILFANVSERGSGGGLEKGDKVYLGRYEANTGIGFVLIANGWNGSEVTYGNWMVYSNPDFNPESTPSLRKHNVNLYDDVEDVIVIGFEDIRRDYSSCDQDFNDALFIVTSNPYDAIEKDDFNPITESGGEQGSGEDGGLESHRGLSNTIAKRNYSKEKNGAVAVPIEMRSTSLLSEVVPLSIAENDQRVITSPVDLEQFTSADVIWSADFFKQDRRFATVFASETSGQVYDHTKVVCDRLAGSELLEIRTVPVSGYDLLLSVLRTAENHIEYAISFSVAITNENDYEVFSRWAITEYPSRETYLNYQIWSEAPYLSQRIADDIVTELNKNYQRKDSVLSTMVAPDVFVVSGQFIDNIFHITLNNTSDKTQNTAMYGSYTQSEFNNIIGYFDETFKVPSGLSTYDFSLGADTSLFDLEFTLRVEGKDPFDVVYLSDGPWGLDYNPIKTEVMSAETHSVTGGTAQGFSITRNPSISYRTEDYISLFKHLKPSGRSVDLSEYNAISFTGYGSGELEVTIVNPAISEWDNQFRFTVTLIGNENDYLIPFELLQSQASGTFDPSEVTMIVFTQKKSGLDIRTLSISDVLFRSAELPSDEMFDELRSSDYLLIPNPADNYSTIVSLEDFDGILKVHILDARSRIIRTKNVNVTKGINNISLSLQDLSSGIYYVELISPSGKSRALRLMKK